MGLWGSKSNETFFSLPSSVNMVPTKSTRPFGGTRLYNFNLCWVLVIAANTESRLTRDLILDAVPYSCVNIAEARDTWSWMEYGEISMSICQSPAHRSRRTFGGMIRLIMEVPALQGKRRSMSAETISEKKSVVPSGRIKTLDELLDLPHLNILLRNVLTHRGRRRMRFLEVLEIHSR